MSGEASLLYGDIKGQKPECLIRALMLRCFFPAGRPKMQLTNSAGLVGVCQLQRERSE